MNRIQEVLKEKGISQVHLAKALGVAKSLVSQYCSNKVQPPLKRLSDISNELGCEISELIKITK